MDNYLARCDPCRCQKNSASSPISPTTTVATSSSSQSAVNSNEGVSEHQRRLLSGHQLNSSNSDLPSSSSSSSQVTMTTVTTSSRQQSMTRCIDDMSLPVDNANTVSVCSRSPPTATYYTDAVLSGMDDVTLDSATAKECTSHRDNDDYDSSGTSEYSTSTPQTSNNHVTVLTSTSSSPSLAATEAAASTPVHTSCSCTRLMGLDDVRSKSVRRRASCIPVPLRVAARCPSHSASLLRDDEVTNSSASSTPVRVPCTCHRLLGLDDERSKSVDSRASSIPVPLRVAAQCPAHGVILCGGGSATNSPINQRHKRCDSGVDLNLSSPDFD